MNDSVLLYVSFNALLGDIGTTISEGMKSRKIFRHALGEFEPSLASGRIDALSSQNFSKIAMVFRYESVTIIILCVFTLYREHYDMPT